MTVGKNDVIHWMLDHRLKVGQRLSNLGNDLAIRGRRHDNTYSEAVEVNQFAAFYNVSPTDPDRDKKRDHYANLVKTIHKKRNDYFHEFFDNGVEGMNMLQLMEYICDRITLWEEFKAGVISPINYDVLTADDTIRNDVYKYVLSGLPALSADMESVVVNTVNYILNRNDVIKQILERSEQTYAETQEK